MAKQTSQYKVIIERDGDGFMAYVPALPGCHTQGDTLEELREHVKEAIELCLEHAEESEAYRAKIAERAEEGIIDRVELITV